MNESSADDVVADAIGNSLNVRGDGPDDRSHEISRLRQQARSLQVELDHRRTLERALRDALIREQEARTEAERTVRYNELFARMLGHDLRNPLNAIATAAQYIALIDGDAKTTAAATRIVGSTRRMARMIDQLLDFTRVRVGDGLTVRRTRVDLAQLCARIRDDLRVADPGSSVIVEAEGNTIGDWDYDRLLEALSNLVDNAIQHGDRCCHVTVGPDATDAAVARICVHNAGVIPAEMLPLVFEPFRGANKHSHSRGLGLGLYLTRQIVVAHGGTIAAASTPAAGTTFEISMPRGARLPEPSRPAASEAPAARRPVA
jgi:signal transduction histidine kinase